MLYKHY
jgi:hypothetical protein